jgi:hypothetical protein
MPSLRPALYAFNRGLVSATALGRVDIERLRLSAAQQTNWFPRSLGPMSLRPGTQYLLSTRSDAKARYIPFFFSTTDKALLECTASFLRPLVNQAVITRASVATVVTNGDFSSGTGWTITGSAGGSGAISGGVLTLSCVPIDSSVTCSRTVTVASGDQNVEHAYRIIVTRGPVTFRCGSTSGGDNYISATSLATGTHSLAFTPTGGTVYIEFESRVARNVIVDSIEVEASGTLTLPTPWDSTTDLDNMRWAQSGDVIYVACFGNQERRIERRTARSWSIVLSEPLDGPFAAVPDVDNVKLTINKARGNGTLTANRSYFDSSMVGSLFRFFTPGYNFTYEIGGEDIFTPAIRVNGVGTGRNVVITTTGTWSGTLTVQKSLIGEESGFYTNSSITTNTTTTVTDTSDNTVMWLRVGFASGGYTSGKVLINVVFGNGGAAPRRGAAAVVTAQGGRVGICRIISVTDSTHAEVDIMSDFSSTESTDDWTRSEWNETKGWPSAVAFHEGRLFRAGRDRVWGSVSDSFMSFDPAVEGDSGPIQRSIGYGPVQTINWILPLTRLLLGTEAAEVAVRSSSFDEPLTPTNFSLKDVSTYGSARLPAVKIDNRGIYVEKSGARVMELLYQVEANDFTSRDMTQLVPDLNQGKAIVDVVVQRQPDTRIHCVRDDGSVAILVSEPAEDVKSWVLFETDGIVEGAVVLPGSEEDEVYYIVKRTINSSTKRYLERFALESECVGGTLNKQMDCFKTYSGSATTTITGLSHLEGKAVVVWADGKDFSPDTGEARTQTTYTVTSGQITLPSAVTSAVVGLPYEARYKSAKLAYAAAGGTALTRKKTVKQIGLLLNKTHHKGLYFGTDFDIMDGLPAVEEGTTVAADTIYDDYDQDMTTMPHTWSTDSRLCLLAKAPRPCTVVAAIIDIETHG